MEIFSIEISHAVREITFVSFLAPRKTERRGKRTTSGRQCISEREVAMPQYKREQWVLANRIRGAATEENFKVCSEDVPEMRKGEILCRALYISIDPITR